MRRAGGLTGRNDLLDSLSLGLVVYFERVEIAGGSELELGDVGLLVLLDGNLLSLREVLLLSPHNLDEFFQILDFLGLQQKRLALLVSNTYHFD